MLHHLPAKPKRVFSDKLAKWKIGEGKYSTQQRITDAGVWHSVVFTCIGIPVPPPPGRTGPSLKSIYRVSYADTGSQLFLRTARGPSKQMHLRTIGNYKWPKIFVNCIIYNGGVNHQPRTVWFLYSCAYTRSADLCCHYTCGRGLSMHLCCSGPSTARPASVANCWR